MTKFFFFPKKKGQMTIFVVSNVELTSSFSSTLNFPMTLRFVDIINI